MGAGASAATSSVSSSQASGRISPPGAILKKSHYPKHVRHLHKHHRFQKALDPAIRGPDTESTVMVPWPVLDTPFLEVNHAENLEVVDEDCSTSAPSSPRSTPSSVVEVLDCPDMLC